MYRCVTKEGEYPNQTRYAEKTEPRVPTTLWSIESNNHKHEMEPQCQNQQGGYAPVWMHHPKMDKLSIQDNLWKVSVWYKLSSRKIIIKTSGLCPSVNISTSKHPWEEYNQSYIIWSKWTSAHQSHRGNVKSIWPPPKKEHVLMWTDISKINY